MLQGLFLIVAASWLGKPWLVVNLVLATGFAALCTLPHELGHALMARAVGLHVFRIVIGIGRERWRCTLFGLPVHVRILPLAGVTQVFPTRRAGARTRILLTVLAGPAVNLALAAAAAWLFGGAARRSLGQGFAPAAAFCFANAWSAVINLVPFRGRSVVGPVWSDGGMLLTLPFWRRARIDQALAGYFAAEAIAAGERGDADGAGAWIARGLTRYPTDALLGTLLGKSLIERREYEAALALHRRMLAFPDLRPDARAVLLNNIAYTHFLIDDPAGLEEADRLSAEAMAQIGWMASILGTRGSVLVALGRPDEGVPLLRRALAGAADDRGRALNACALALGLLQQGERDEARALAGTARQLDASCALLERLTAALADAERRAEAVLPTSRVA